MEEYIHKLNFIDTQEYTVWNSPQNHWFLDFVNCMEFQMLGNMTVWKLDIAIFWRGEGNTHSFGSLRKI
jgi:hypothetical protein